MRLIVNGKEMEAEASRVDALLTELKYEGKHIAVSVNFDVVPRTRWAETLLKNGDAIEILTPRQGG
jgi:sulfur carrier protein